jgi:hypothetical protein
MFWLKLFQSSHVSNWLIVQFFSDDVQVKTNTIDILDPSKLQLLFFGQNNVPEYKAHFGYDLSLSCIHWESCGEK